MVGRKDEDTRKKGKMALKKKNSQTEKSCQNEPKTKTVAKQKNETKIVLGCLAKPRSTGWAFNKEGHVFVQCELFQVIRKPFILQQARFSSKYAANQLTLKGKFQQQKFKFLNFRVNRLRRAGTLVC